MGSEPGGSIFSVLIFAMTFGFAIYRARNEPPWKIVLAIWIGLGISTLMVLALLWAGTDTTRLTILAVPVVITAGLAAVAVVVRSVRRWRSAPRAKSPFDFTQAQALDPGIAGAAGRGAWRPVRPRPRPRRRRGA